MARRPGCIQANTPAIPKLGNCGPFIVFTERNLGSVKARLDDRLGVAAVTYLLFGVTLGPGLALEAPKPFGTQRLPMLHIPLQEVEAIAGNCRRVSHRWLRGWRLLANFLLFSAKCVRPES